jgi:iron complex outermembrane recepter protein
VTIKAGITPRLSFRGGLFYSGGERLASYVDIYTLLDPGGRSSHVLVADPYLDVHSLSGEAQLAYRFATGNVHHRLIAGFRARNRLTQYGGAGFLSSRNQPTFGDKDSIPEETFTFGPINEGRVKQSSIMLGYTGRLDGLASINLGLQKTRYRATTNEGRTGLVTLSRDDPWLYNVGLGIDLSPGLSLYVATQTGLEDSGFAPENAANSNALLPATRATQYEGGLRWKFHGGQMMVNMFQITKPYFTFDSANFYVEQGSIRNRGLELSLSGHFFDKRLSLLAGGLFMQPRVTGGLRPAGTPSSNIRIDVNYRTDIFGGVTPTVSLAHIGARAVSSRAFASLGGKQLTLPGYTTVDVGLRQQFKIGKVPASFRAVLQNVFDTATWKVLAANTLTVEERRRFSLSLAADF